MDGLEDSVLQWEILAAILDFLVVVNCCEIDNNSNFVSYDIRKLKNLGSTNVAKTAGQLHNDMYYKEKVNWLNTQGSNNKLH